MTAHPIRQQHGDTDEEEIQVAFCFDEKLVSGVLVAAASCIRAATLPHRFHFIFPDAAEQPLREAFRTFERWRAAHPAFPPCRFSFVPVSAATYERLPSTPSLPKAAALRLLIDTFLPHLDKVLYLDGDVFVTDSLAPLWKTDLGDTFLAAVEDGLIRKGHEGYPYLRKVRLSGQYFNSGVLLIRLPRWREARIGERAIAELNAEPVRCGFLDQDALNILFDGQWTRLPDKWNIVLSHHPLASRWYALFHRRIPPPAKGIYHFAGAGKPWSALCYSRIRFAYRAFAREVFPSFACTPSPSRLRALPMWLPAPLYRLVRAFYQYRAFSPRRDD